MSYSGRHLGFHTLKMVRKNDTLIFFKAYDVFFQNQVSFCFYQKKNTKLQMSLHYILAKPCIDICQIESILECKHISNMADLLEVRQSPKMNFAVIN